ncbi:MAG TPA: hypothetical protein VH253_07690 [Phycisphaerae bacterium]|nr:hypothetical protein [Phycisphaerae bacterium]
MPPSPPPPKGMSKWVIIAIVVLLIIIVGCCGGVTACWLVARRAAKAAADLSPISRNEAGGLTIRSGGGEFNIGALPANFPSDIPIYTGMKPLESAIDKDGNGTVSLTGSGAPSDVADWYQDHMKSQGWTLTDSGNAGDTQHQAYRKAGRQASVLITGSGSESTVIIGVGKGDNTPGPGAAAPEQAPQEPANPLAAASPGDAAPRHVADASGKPLKLPSNFPSDLPVYSGMNSTFSASDNLSGEGSVLLQGSADHQTLVDYYRKQMKDAGWEQTDDTEVAGVSQMTYTKDVRKAQVQVSAGDNGTTMLMLSYSKK